MIVLEEQIESAKSQKIDCVSLETNFGSYAINPTIALIGYRAAVKIIKVDSNKKAGCRNERTDSGRSISDAFLIFRNASQIFSKARNFPFLPL